MEMSLEPEEEGGSNEVEPSAASLSSKEGKKGEEEERNQKRIKGEEDQKVKREKNRLDELEQNIPMPSAITGCQKSKTKEGVEKEKEGGKEKAEVVNRSGGFSVSSVSSLSLVLFCFFIS